MAASEAEKSLTSYHDCFYAFVAVLESTAEAQGICSIRAWPRPHHI